MSGLGGNPKDRFSCVAVQIKRFCLLLTPTFILYLKVLMHVSEYDVLSFANMRFSDFSCVFQLLGFCFISGGVVR